MGVAASYSDDKQSEDGTCASGSRTTNQKPRPVVRKRSGQLRASVPDKPDTTPYDGGILGKARQSEVEEA